MYPEKFINDTQIGKVGDATIHRPLKDSRERQWVWEGLRPNTPGYSGLYDLLINFQVRLRLNAGKPVWMFLKEDVSNNLTKLSWNGTSFDEVADFVRVKVIDVSQSPSADNMGYVRYSTRMVFVIDDTLWNNF